MTFRAVVRGMPGAVLALLLVLAVAGSVFGQSQNLPPKPDRYVTDKAGVVDAGTLASINNQLEQFERDTSNQIVVAIYRSLPSDANIDQYTIDTYNAWKIGQKGKDNGALLLIAINDRKMFICTGRGLEGALPDAICKNIITQQITPRFKQGDYAGGIQAGVDSIIAASKGEYKGTGLTANDTQDQGQGLPTWVVILIIIIFIIAISSRGSGGYPMVYTGGGWGSGGFGGGGGGGGFGGGGFSGGGGSSAGGGAGGGW